MAAPHVSPAVQSGAPITGAPIPGTLIALIQVGLLSAAWCALHSFFVSLTWHRLVARAAPGVQAVNRLAFVLCSTASLLALLVWFHRHPARPLWDWPPALAPVRWAGLAAAGLLFWLGARAHDNRVFLGLAQMRSRKGQTARHDPPRTRAVSWPGSGTPGTRGPCSSSCSAGPSPT